ncbi:MAG: DUF4175 family protein [Alphaproteobacteria bacterium]|nr:DUF4175 family protein [Alphaproteobacteria bacterium]
MGKRNQFKTMLGTRRLYGLKALALILLLYERLSLRFWRIVCWFLLFGTLWLFRIPASLGYSAEIIALLSFVGGTVFFIWKDVRHFRFPDSDDVLRRVEKDGGIPHRPLTALSDQPINTHTEEALTLWQIQQQKLALSIQNLKFPYPRAFLASKDPRAIRLGLGLAFLCGIIIAGPHAGERLYLGLMPFNAPDSTTLSQNSGPTLWITPPAYTGKEQIILQTIQTQNQETISIPEDSRLKIFLEEPGFLSFGKLALYADEARFPLIPSEGGTYRLEMPVPLGKRLILKTGRFKSPSWNYALIPDTPPTIEITKEPLFPGQGQFQIPLTLTDDYGVQELQMNMEAAMSPVGEPLGEPFGEMRSVMSPPGAAFSMAPLYDLSAHPWAGSPALVTFIARDHKGQETKTAPIPIVLPERAFTHPLARALIDVRKQIIRAPDQSYEAALIALERILMHPESFAYDRQIHMAVRAAASRMRYNDPARAIAKGIIDLLWRAALRLEDGGLSLAAQDLRAAQTALENALKNPDIPPAEIAALMEKLRSAMSAYLQSLAREMQKRMAEGEMPPELPQEMLDSMMNPDDLASMLDKMEADMMSGDKNAAQKMLSQLQRLLDMMNPSLDAAMPQDMQAMIEGMNEIREIIKRQEAVLGKTQEQADILSTLDEMGVPESTFRQEPFEAHEKNRAEQESLRDALRVLIEKAQESLPQVPENFENAESEMTGAVEQLRANQPDMAVSFQKEALAHLKKSQEQLSQMMAQRMKQMTGFAFGGQPMRPDPLGRQGRPPSGSDVKVPSEAEAKRIQEIVNELRRRAGERERPPEELEYYRRLLKRF